MAVAISLFYLLLFGSFLARNHAEFDALQAEMKALDVHLKGRTGNFACSYRGSVYKAKGVALISMCVGGLSP